MNKGDLILVSVDDHICEPVDMFDAHVPKRYKQMAPCVVEEPDGRQQWWYGDRQGRHVGLNATAGKPPTMYNLDAIRFEDMRRGCFDVHERVRDMSAGGQLAGLNFPNWPGFSGQVLNEGPDAALNEIMIKAYNDWHVDEWCGAYPERFIPCGLVPYFDVERAAKEVRRLATKGCHAIAFSENPEALGMPSIHSRHWDPLFGACNDEGTVICMHVGSSSRSPQTVSDAPLSVGLTLSPLNSLQTLTELLWSDFWYRFPDLRVSMTEGDIGWMPYFVDRAEHVYARHYGWTGEVFPEGSGPETIFHERIICCFISEAVGVELLGHFNLDNVCWEGDFPHSDGIWPVGPETVEKVMAGLDEQIVNKITHQNALRHFQFEPFKYRERARCTVDALRAEAPDVDTVTRVGTTSVPAEQRALLAQFQAAHGMKPASPPPAH